MRTTNLTDKIFETLKVQNTNFDVIPITDIEKFSKNLIEHVADSKTLHPKFEGLGYNKGELEGDADKIQRAIYHDVAKMYDDKFRLDIGRGLHIPDKNGIYLPAREGEAIAKPYLNDNPINRENLHIPSDKYVELLKSVRKS